MVTILLKIFYDYGCEDYKVTTEKGNYYTFNFHYKNFDYIETEISSN